MAGGYFSEDTSEFLDLDTLIWSPKASLPYSINSGTSVPWLDSFLIVGGDSNVESYLDTIYYYDPTSDRWQNIGHLDYRRRSSAAFLVPDDYANCS